MNYKKFDFNLNNRETPWVYRKSQHILLFHCDVGGLILWAHCLLTDPLLAGAAVGVVEAEEPVHSPEVAAVLATIGPIRLSQRPLEPADGRVPCGCRC